MVFSKSLLFYSLARRLANSEWRIANGEQDPVCYLLFAKQIRSRDAPASESCNKLRSPHPTLPRKRGRVGWGRGRRRADRRIHPVTAPHIRALPLECARARQRAANDPLARTACCGRARLSAHRRGSRRSGERCDSAQAALDATGRAGRYPRRRSRLSQAPGSPVVMPAGTMPGPPGSGVCRSARRNRSRSAFRSTLAKGVPHDSMSGIGGM